MSYWLLAAHHPEPKARDPHVPIPEILRYAQDDRLPKTALSSVMPDNSIQGLVENAFMHIKKWRGIGT